MTVEGLLAPLGMNAERLMAPTVMVRESPANAVPKPETEPMETVVGPVVADAATKFTVALELPPLNCTGLDTVPTEVLELLTGMLTVGYPGCKSSYSKNSPFESKLAEEIVRIEVTPR